MPDDTISRDDATLLLHKFLIEETPLLGIFGEQASPSRYGMHLQCRINSLEPRIDLGHPEGNTEGFFHCEWSSILSFHYAELRDEANRFTNPAVSEFIRNRSCLVLIFAGNVSLFLLDLSQS